MRKRAKHRLIGAVVLVLIGVIGFPLLFDTQPRPVAVDIPIEIPGKNTVKPLVMPAPAVAPAPKVAASAPVAASEKVAAPSSLEPREEIVSEKAAALATPAPPATKTEAKPEPAKPEPTKTEPKSTAKTPVSSDDAARAKALLEGKTVAPAAAKVASAEAEGRVVVQVGAFADESKAREVRQKLERAGLKTYTQVAETKDGKRIRVRVGPFATRADADKAASKIKGLDLPAAILTL